MTAGLVPLFPEGDGRESLDPDVVGVAFGFALEEEF